MTDNPGTFRRRVGRVGLVLPLRRISITRYREVKRAMQGKTYETVYHSANDVIHVGTKATQYGEKSSPKRSGRSFRPSSSQDKGLKNG
jgi:hypothetical protein